MTKRAYRSELVELGGQPVEQFVLPITGGRRARRPARWPPPAQHPPAEIDPPALTDLLEAPDDPR